MNQYDEYYDYDRDGDAEQHTDWYGNPKTLWANVAGLTHASQSIGFADDRATVDRAAGRLMQMAF